MTFEKGLINSNPKSYLWNGDCLDLMKYIPDKSIDSIICDLPYGTTACKWDSVIPLDKLWRQYERIIKDNGVLALFAGEPFTSMLISSNINNFRYRLTWDKMQGSGFLNSKKRPLTRVEDICIFSKAKLGNSTYNPQLVNKETSKIRAIVNRKPINVTTYGEHNCKFSDHYDNTKSHPTDLISQSSKQAECNPLNRIHPTQKPVELLKYLVKTYTNENEWVLDNTCGSNTTGVACLELNRNYIGIEQDKDYYNIGKNRIIERSEQLKGMLFTN